MDIECRFPFSILLVMADMDFDYLRLKIVLFLTFFMIIGIPSNLKSYSTASPANVFQYAYTGAGSNDNDDWIFESVSSYAIEQSVEESYIALASFFDSGVFCTVTFNVTARYCEDYVPYGTGPGYLDFYKRKLFVAVTASYPRIFLDSLGFNFSCGSPTHYDTVGNYVNTFQFSNYSVLIDTSWWHYAAIENYTEVAYIYNTSNYARVGVQIYRQDFEQPYANLHIIDLELGE